MDPCIFYFWRKICPIGQVSVAIKENVLVEPSRNVLLGQMFSWHWKESLAWSLHEWPGQRRRRACCEYIWKIYGKLKILLKEYFASFMDFNNNCWNSQFIYLFLLIWSLSPLWEGAAGLIDWLCNMLRCQSHTCKVWSHIYLSRAKSDPICVLSANSAKLPSQTQINISVDTPSPVCFSSSIHSDQEDLHCPAALLVLGLYAKITSLYRSCFAINPTKLFSVATAKNLTQSPRLQCLHTWCCASKVQSTWLYTHAPKTTVILAVYFRSESVLVECLTHSIIALAISSS